MMSHAEHARFVYNLGVEQYAFASRYRPYRIGPRRSWPSASERDRQLTEARAEHGWLRAGSQVVQQQALRDLDQAYKNWWKRPDHYGRPIFRQKNRPGNFRCVGKEFKIRQINERWGQVYVPKGGWVKFRLTRPWSLIEAAKSCRFSQDVTGTWHVSFPSPQPRIERSMSGAVVGIDRGVANTIATSDGAFEHIPTLSRGEQRRSLNLGRQLARRKPGSNRRLQSRRANARLHGTLTNRRRNWIEQSTTNLVRDNDIVITERLLVCNMVRSSRGTVEKPGVNVAAKAGLNRMIYASSWGGWLDRLKQKAEASGVLVIEVPARNTSRTCAVCSHVAQENRESQAVFKCVSCGHQAHADLNAAINILNRGMARINAAGHAVSAQGDLGSSRSMNCETLTATVG